MTTIAYDFVWETYAVQNAWIEVGTEGFSSPNTYWSFNRVDGTPPGAIRCTSHVLSGVASENGVPGDFRCIYIPSISPLAVISSATVDWTGIAHTSFRSENPTVTPGTMSIYPRKVAATLCLPYLLPVEHNPLMDWRCSPSITPSPIVRTFGPYDGTLDYGGSSGFTTIERQDFSGLGVFDGTNSNGIELSRLQTSDPFIPLYPAVSFLRPNRSFFDGSGNWINNADQMTATGTCRLTIVYS